MVAASAETPRLRVFFWQTYWLGSGVAPQPERRKPEGLPLVLVLFIGHVREFNLGTAPLTPLLQAGALAHISFSNVGDLANLCTAND